MNLSAEILKKYFAEHPLRYAITDAELLLDDLYWHYTETNLPINERLRSLSVSAEPYFAQLSLDDSNALFGIFCDLSTEQERLAFRGGMRMGMQLLLELLEQKPDPT